MKSLEDWQEGRDVADDSFRRARWARVVEKIWKGCVKAGDWLFVALDTLSGGDVAKNRKAERAREVEMREWAEHQAMIGEGEAVAEDEVRVEEYGGRREEGQVNHA